MSNKEQAGFPINKNSDGSFSVNMDGNNICVQTPNEAWLLSILPLELNKILTNTSKRPSVGNVKKIIKLCGEYNINSQAVRKLKSWLKKHNQ